MELFSILAIIARVASDGTTLSSTLFGVRNAPSEMQRLAGEMTTLTSTIEHLHEILIAGSPYVKESLLLAVQEALKYIESTIKETQAMVDDRSSFRRFRRTKIESLRSDIEKHKVAIMLQTSILSTAMLFKTMNRYARKTHEDLPTNHLDVRSESNTDDAPNKNKHRLQSENIVQAGQATLRMDRLDLLPPVRVPSPPRRTDKQLPGPVNHSEVPGHASSDALFSHSLDPIPESQSSSTLTEGHMSQTFSTSATRYHGASYAPSSVEDVAEDFDEEDLYGYESFRPQKDQRQNSFDIKNAKNSRLERFCPKLHDRGDAATFLYKLVFQQEEQEDSGYLSESQSESEESSSESDNTEEGEQGELYYTARHRHVARQHRPRPRAPSAVVDHLLLEWTSLTRGELDAERPQDAERRATEREYLAEAPPEPVRPKVCHF